MIVDAKFFKEKSGKTQPAAIERWLEKQDIKYFHGVDGPWTTEALLNAAKGLGLPEQSSEDIL